MNESVFHTLFAVSFSIFVVIRVAARRMAQASEGKVTYKEGNLNRVFRLGLGLPFILSLLVYMFYPPLLAWANFDLPEPLRWVGAALMFGSLALLVWVQWALGSNFDTTLHVREEHTLVTHGPYRWVRHPMYTVFYLFELGILLLTANWFIGGVMLVAQTVVLITRVANEETAMREKFGPHYDQYRQRTGRFLPKLR